MLVDGMFDMQEIIVHGVNGRKWHVSGPRAGDEGVIVSPKMKNVIDAPVKTFWIPSAQSSAYQGKKWLRRDPMYTFIINGNSPGHWREIDSEFRQSFDYADEAVMEHKTGDGSRYLGVRLLSEPKAYETLPWEGKDPHLYGDASLLIPGACENPHYMGRTLASSYTIQSGTSGSANLPFWNEGDVEMWLEYVIIGPPTGNKGIWTLPDFSWQDDAGAARTVTLPQIVQADGTVTVLTRQSQEQLVSSNKTGFWPRAAGKRFIYPVPKHTGTALHPKFLPVSVTNAQPGCGVQVRFTPAFTRPFGMGKR